MHKPDMTLTTEVAPTLKPVLKALARSFSSVRSKYYYELGVETFTSCLRFQLVGFVYEDNMWAIKGCYKLLLKTMRAHYGCSTMVKIFYNLL
jgi:hypothetical protein